MGLDIRLPIGLMFTALGPILIGTGIMNHTPINWKTGCAVLAFGLCMLGLGVRAHRRK